MKIEEYKNNENTKEGKKENVDENKENKNPLQSENIKKRTLKDRKVKFSGGSRGNLNNNIKQKDTNIIADEINRMNIQNNNKSNINKNKTKKTEEPKVESEEAN